MAFPYLLPRDVDALRPSQFAGLMGWDLYLTPRPPRPLVRKAKATIVPRAVGRGR